MRWLLHLLTREDPEPSTIATLESLDVGEAVDVTGTIELLDEGLRNPLDGEPAVALHYEITPRRYGDYHVPVSFECYQGASFLLRDATGVAVVEIEAGEDVAAFHRHHVEVYGAGNPTTVEQMGPGDRVRVRGHIRARADPRAATEAERACVIGADAVEHS